MAAASGILVTLDNSFSQFALSNFQVPIPLSSGNAYTLFQGARADGADIAVYDASGSTLQNFWLSSFNKSGLTGNIWLKVPSLPQGASGQYLLEYARPSQTSSSGSYVQTMTRVQLGAGVSHIWHCDDGAGSSLAEAGGGTAATVVNGPPLWEPQDGGLPGVRYGNDSDTSIFSTTGTWTNLTSAGFGLDEHYASGVGADVATWTFTGLAPGPYRISTNWLPTANRATNSPFSYYDNTTLLGTTTINQQNSPSSLTDCFNVGWQDIAVSGQINSGTLQVKLSDNANGFVIADAIRVEPLGVNAPFSGSAVTLQNASSQCITVPGFTGVTMPASGAIAFWFRNKWSNIYGGSTGSANVNYRLLTLLMNGITNTNTGNLVDVYWTSSNTISLNVSYNNTLVTTTGPTTDWPAGKWHHFVFSWNASLRQIWIDGSLEIAQTTNGNGNQGLPSGQSAVNALTIGAYYQNDNSQAHFNATPQACWDATIDEIVVLNHQPLPEEITALYKRRAYAKGMGQSGRWTKQGVIITAPSWNGADNAIEPAFVYIDANHQKMFLTARTPSSPTVQIGLEVASDGGLGTWSDGGSNPVANPANGANVVKDGSTYYLFYTDLTTLFYKTTTDFITFSAATNTGISTASITNCINIYNPCVFFDPKSNTYKLFIEGKDSVQYRTYQFTSGSSTLAGATWTIANGGNPLTSLAMRTGGGFSRMRLLYNQLGDNTWDAWYHASAEGFGPSHILHSRSTDTINWTTPDVVMQLETENFSGTAADQVADVDFPFYLNGATRLYYDINYNLTNYAGSITYATYQGTIAQVLTDPPAISFGTAQTLPDVFGQVTLTGELSLLARPGLLFTTYAYLDGTSQILDIPSLLLGGTTRLTAEGSLIGKPNVLIAGNSSFTTMAQLTASPHLLCYGNSSLSNTLAFLASPYIVHNGSAFLAGMSSCIANGSLVKLVVPSTHKFAAYFQRIFGKSAPAYFQCAFKGG